MLADIQTAQLSMLFNPQPTTDGPEDAPDDPEHNKCKDHVGGHIEKLQAKLAEPVAGEQTLVHVEEADGKGVLKC